jgi:hypothetical protein
LKDKTLGVLQARCFPACAISFAGRLTPLQLLLRLGVFAYIIIYVVLF